MSNSAENISRQTVDVCGRQLIFVDVKLHHFVMTGIAILQHTIRIVNRVSCDVTIHYLLFSITSRCLLTLLFLFHPFWHMIVLYDSGCLLPNHLRGERWTEQSPRRPWHVRRAPVSDSRSPLAACRGGQSHTCCQLLLSLSGRLFGDCCYFGFNSFLIQICY